VLISLLKNRWAFRLGIFTALAQTTALEVCAKAGIDSTKRVHQLSEAEILQNPSDY
jgi:ribosomal protein S13